MGMAWALNAFSEIVFEFKLNTFEYFNPLDIVFRDKNN